MMAIWLIGCVLSWTISMLAGAHGIPTPNCTWTDPASGKTLDLTPIQGVILNTTDYLPFGGYNVSIAYSVCDNTFVCGLFYEMACEWPPEGTAAQYGQTLAHYDSSVQPVYSVDANGANHWSFLYDNGQPCLYNARVFAPEFICDEDVEYAIGLINELVLCYYQVEIRTMFACDNYTTTPPPDNSCRYEADNATLDLTSLRGTLLNVPLNGTSNVEYFMYTPCQNTVKCGEDDASMAYIFDFNSLNCTDVVAVWDDGLLQPVYSAQAQLWQFSYVNGAECNGGHTVFNLEFVCNESANQPKVLQAQQIAQCLYQMVIASVLACA